MLLVLSHFVLHDSLRPVEWFALGDDRHRARPARPVDRHACRPRRRAGAPGVLPVLAAIPTSAVGLVVFRDGGPGPQLRAPVPAPARSAVRRGRRPSLRRGRARAQVGCDLRPALGSHRFGAAPDRFARSVRARRRHGDRPRAVPDRSAALLGGGRVTGEHRDVHRLCDRGGHRAVQRAPSHLGRTARDCASRALLALWSVLSPSRCRARGTRRPWRTSRASTRPRRGRQVRTKKSISSSSAGRRSSLAARNPPSRRGGLPPASRLATSS